VAEPNLHQAGETGKKRQLNGDPRATAVQRLGLTRDDASAAPAHGSGRRSSSRGPQIATVTSNSRHSSIT
jgi:hypothetical protein